MNAAARLRDTEQQLLNVEHEIAALARWERLNGSPLHPLRAAEAQALAVRYLALVGEREEQLADVPEPGLLRLSGYGCPEEKLSYDQRPLVITRRQTR